MSQEKKPYARRWTTQPKVVEGGELLCDVYIEHIGIINVIDVGGDIYVTVGGLFGQQTMKVPNERAVLAVIDMANKRVNKEPMPVPDGWVLCDEEKDAA